MRCTVYVLSNDCLDLGFSPGDYRLLTGSLRRNSALKASPASSKPNGGFQVNWRLRVVKTNLLK